MIIETNGQLKGSLDVISPGDTGEKFQGAVRLRVAATESVQTVISFVNELREKHDVRVLELVGTIETGVDIQLVLRMPIPFVAALKIIEGVSEVETYHSALENNGEPMFIVHMATVVPSANSHCHRVPDLVVSRNSTGSQWVKVNPESNLQSQKNT